MFINYFVCPYQNIKAWKLLNSSCNDWTELSSVWKLLINSTIFPSWMSIDICRKRLEVSRGSFCDSRFSLADFGNQFTAKLLYVSAASMATRANICTVVRFAYWTAWRFACHLLNCVCLEWYSLPSLKIILVE